MGIVQVNVVFLYKAHNSQVFWSNFGFLKEVLMKLSKQNFYLFWF